MPGPDQIRRALLVAVAELDLIAGWAGLDAVRYPGYVPTTATTELAKSRDLWLAGPDATSGDPNSVAARLGIAQGRWDQAEPFAVSSVRRWQPVSRLASAHSAMLLATIHVRAGEPDAPRLAHDAITAVSTLSSIRAWTRLIPLAETLDTRRATDAQDLARQARHVAATRP